VRYRRPISSYSSCPIRNRSQGNVALIIGGAGAIGAATCRMQANAGATVAITQMPGTDHAAKAGKVNEGLSGHGHAAFSSALSSWVLSCLNNCPPFSNESNY
jgi:NAD(P)-dependent dehydrogenase (short-subunit alcohol dehydrogenase family)